ncbi:MAG: DNA mismatch repair endonuclease MutL [Idiomarina sp.]|nr:DNA mismatch repair endonuclease MutL [Idiomarina sp.]
MPIQLLPPQLANQIAAGEVVERPASVVKELVENCIDAGATEIRIDIEKGGARRIRIRDNGSGIAKDELTLALSRHATSKISTLDDLEAIASLGFRGEALASISSVARLRLTSKPAAQTEAWQAWCEGRDMSVQLEPAAHPNGTTVDVEDLFFNTPARRKFLRTEKTEFAHIDEVVRRIALARPDIDIQLSHNQQLLRNYRVANTEQKVAQRLQQIAGKRFSEEALYLETKGMETKGLETRGMETNIPETNGPETNSLDTAGLELNLHGWIAPPSACRHQGDVQYMYVNGRMMKDKLLNHAVRQAYAESLPEDKQATFVLYIELPAHEVDVNVHPAKHEVRFHQARQVHDFVLAALRNALAPYVREQQQAQHHYRYQALTPNNEAAHYQAAEANFANPAQNFANDMHKTTDAGNAHSAAKQGQASANVGILPGAGGRPGFATGASAAPSAASETAAAPASLSQPLSTEEPLGAAGEQLVWQQLSMLQNRWLLIKGVNGESSAQLEKLYVLDLQRAQQQVLCQRIRQQLSTGLAGQPLLLPVQLQINAALLQLPMHVYSQLGLLLVQGKTTQQHREITVQQVPSMLRNSNISAVLPQLLEQLQALWQQSNATEESAQGFIEQVIGSALPNWLAAQAVQLRFTEQDAKQLWQQIKHIPQWQQLLNEIDWQANLSENNPR